MKDLKESYEIFGLQEGATLEQVVARWMELKGKLQSKSRQGEKTRKALKEINEAYEALKGSAPSSLDFDMRRFLRETADSRRAKKEQARKKIIISSVAILATICLIIGAYIFISERPPVTTGLASTSQDDPNRKIRKPIEETTPAPPSESQAAGITAKASLGELSKTDILETAKPTPKTPSLKTVPPLGKKLVSPEPSKKAMSEIFKLAPATPPSLNAPPSVEVAKKVALPEPNKKFFLEAARPVPPAPPAATPAPLVEVAKEVPREPIKPTAPGAPVPPVPTSLGSTSPVEAAKEVSQEPIRTVVPEIAKPTPPVPPAGRPAPPVEVTKVVVQEPDNPAPPPSGLPNEGEVRQFLGGYISSYNKQSTDGLISFFSPKAVQNKKDNLEKIRKTYESFFDQMEGVQYRVTINDIKPQQNSVEVRGQYQLDGVMMNTRKKVNWKGQIRWVLVREDGEIKILSLDYQPQK